MISLVRGGGRLFPAALAAGLAAWVLSAPSHTVEAGDVVCPTCHKPHAGVHNHPGSGVGTLGYGKPGLYPGFQGFGLGYHLGYGYGGRGLGVGADGGFPFYGGPGYLHPAPRLRRFGGTEPFPFYGGPGGPTPSCPNYFGGVGPLMSDRPVIEIDPEPGEADYASGYGGFTGVLPYPESVLAPFTTAAARNGSSGLIGSSSLPNPTPAPGAMLDEQAASRSIGIDVEPFSDDVGQGLKVTTVYPGSPAQTAGLRDGDVIRSINGYLTKEPVNLSWIMANAAPGRTLKMAVHRAGDSQERTITVQASTAPQ